MEDTFNLCAAKRVHRENYDFNLEIPGFSQVRFVLEVYGYKVQRWWKTLPYHIKVPENLEILKRVLKFCDGENHIHKWLI